MKPSDPPPGREQPAGNPPGQVPPCAPADDAEQPTSSAPLPPTTTWGAPGTDTLAAPRPAWLAAEGEPVAGYRLLRLLGRGGFGEVWEALGPGELHVAIKLVPVTAGEIERRALDLIKHVRHPHLLALFGIWQRDGWLIIGMERAERPLSGHLADFLRQGFAGVPAGELRRYLRETADVLDFLNKPRHFLGGPEPVALQHGDVKPQNLLLLSRHVKVGDFGLVRVLDAVQVAAGLTPAYAAPEVFAGRPSRRSDQYALAVAYCELRGGKLPFTASTAAEYAAAHTALPPDLSMLPETERLVVARALSKDPRQRWPTCRAFVRALSAVQESGSHPSLPSARVRVRGGPPVGEDPVSEDTEMLPDEAPAPSPPRAAWRQPGRTGQKAAHVRSPRGPGLVRLGCLLAFLGVLPGGLLVLLCFSLALPAPLGPSGPFPWGLLALVLGGLPSLLVLFWLVRRLWAWWDRRRFLASVDRHAAEAAQGEASAADELSDEIDLSLEVEDGAEEGSEFELNLDSGVLGIPEASSEIALPSVDDREPIEEPPSRSLHGHEEPVWGVALAPDGRIGLSGGMDGVVCMWELPGGRLRRRVGPLGAGVAAVAFAPAGERFALALLDGSVRLHDAATAAEVLRLPGHAGRALAVTFHPSGKYLLSSGEDGLVRLWRIASGQEFRCFTGHPGWVYAQAVSPDGQWVASGGPDGVRLHAVTDGQEVGPPPAEGAKGVRCLAFSPDGTLLAKGHEDGTLAILDLVAGQELELEGHRDWVRALAFSPDGQRLVSGGDDESLRTWTRQSTRWVSENVEQTAEESVLALVWSPRGLLVGTESGRVHFRPGGPVVGSVRAR